MFRWRRYSGGYKDHDHERRLCHDCHHRSNRPNTTGVRSIEEISPSCLADQLDAVFADIFPDAVKIGMVSSPALIQVIADRLTFYQAKNIVVDPVMVATSGSSLLKTEALHALTHQLFPLADLVTPNIPEAERSIRSAHPHQGRYALCRPENS